MNQLARMHSSYLPRLTVLASGNNGLVGTKATRRKLLGAKRPAENL